ncbi:MAG: phage terminase large subunit [Candidatus Pacebacteria bacterium]|nr:phage terminase large subunit [Candidatus Paceibacterota bacterium]
MKPNNMIPQALVEQMTKDRKIRTAITKESFSYFFHFYYAHYVKYATADFQKEIISLVEKSDKENLFVVAFRGSGKSTVITAAYPIWAILGKQEKKFVVIFCQTQAQAKQHMMNLRRELEDNDLLKKDLGPFRENSDEWGAQSIVFSNTDARITVASVDQSIRGIRHYQHRPDLIICDDVEDISSTKTREGRNKTYQWLKSEVIPAGDRDTRLIIVGNLLHEDSLLMRLKEEREKEVIDGNFLFYPLIDKKGDCLWPGKYPTDEDIENERRKVGNEITWQQEYLLNIVPSEDQAIFQEWINYYDEIPAPLKLYGGYSSYMEIRIGIDPAISKSDVADYTAMVPGMLYETTSNYKLYILPKIINKRLSFPETVDACKTLYQSYKRDSVYPKFIIEDVAYQKALPQQLQVEGIYNVMTTRPGNQDKRSRLIVLANLIKTGQILFPKEGAEELIQQIVHFGVEKHDDLADAFANLAHSMIEKPPRSCRVYWV